MDELTKLRLLEQNNGEALLATAKSLTASIEVLRADLVSFRVLELNAVQIHLQKLELEIKMLKFQAAVIAAVFTGVIEIVSRFLFK